jgi:uncharacterized protein (TIGR03663 family)
MKKNFKTIFILIVILAFGLRFYDLEFKAYNWDEAVHAWITRSLVESGSYSYAPVYHGPMQFYFTGIMFSLLGFNEFAGRVLPALAGVLLVIALYPLRKFIGEKAVLITAFLITISPTFLYYSRFFRNDIYVALFTLVIFVSGILYTKTQKSKYIILAALSLGLSLASKENTLITGFIFLSYLAFYFFYKMYRKKYSFSDLVKAGRKNINHILLFWAVSFIIVSAFYTGFFSNINALSDSIIKGADYWIGQHHGGKFAAPFYFYIGRMWLYELPILIFGILGIVHYYKKPDNIKIFLIHWTLFSFFIYSALQEKMPQLLLNIILPMSILASMYISEKVDLKKALGYVLIGTIILTLFSGIRAVYINPTDSREPIMYAQTEQQIKNFAGLVKEAAFRIDDVRTKMQILHNPGEGLSSPVYWYLWDYTNKEFLVQDISRATAPIVVSMLWNNETARDDLKSKGYSESRFYTWGYVNHDENFFNYLDPKFYFLRETKSVSEQGIIYLYTK